MPGSDFSSHDPDFGPDQIAQCARLVAGARELNRRLLRLSGSAEDLSAAADRLDALLASLEPVNQTRAMETFAFRFDSSDPNATMPFNPATGGFNPVAPELAMSLEGDTLVVRMEFGDSYESGPDTVQGGMVAALYDQMLAFVVMAAGKTGHTAWLKVTYLKPTPINQPLRFEARVASVDGKKYATLGACYLGDVKISEAEALVLGAYDLLPAPSPDEG
ncbi:MAG: PaaI family thioesterase [Deltaproteobacteria bacterium]|nr:PaaI family thioesterase [Deltaproteobacteria bacterium]MBW2444727.1 PaaI family thioesterase [Deltaproteobacteria bacterium]